MSDLNQFSDGRLSRGQRVCLAAGAVVLGGLLAVAGSLQADPRGLGTHQQLGLPPCTIQTWWGHRCPSCGMTTSWAHFMRGHWRAALTSNAGGALLALSAAAVVPWWLGSAVRGRWLWIRPADWAVVAYCLTILVVTVTDWLWRVVPGLWS